MLDYIKHFTKIDWMASGTPSQRDAFQALTQLSIFHDLKEFRPTFAGTIPIGVDTDGSDFDILCEVNEFNRFQTRLKDCFQGHKNFLITEKYVKGDRSIVCRFESGRYRIEIFGQRKPPERQDAFLHMVAEAKLLAVGGEFSIAAIRKLKESGIKTEPAFAQFFKIPGEPFEAILKLAPLTIEEIRSKVSQFKLES